MAEAKKDDAFPLITEVVRQDLCIACGACVQACPKQAITPSYDKMLGAHGVSIVDPSACVGCDAPCDAVCPSIETDFSILAAQNIDRTGPSTGIYTGYSPPHQNNGVSSSGGIVRMFVQKALSEDMPVVCLGDTGHEFRMMRLDNIDDMQKARGSIYHSVSLHDTIDLLRDSPRPALLVSIPCQLAGIKKYIQTVEPALESKIAMIVGLICGWQFTDHAIKAFAAHNKIKPQPERTEYRGEDRAGKLKIHNETGQVLTYDRRVFENKGELNIYKSSFARYANRMRCRICQDHLNVLADIAVGDAWIKAAEGRKLSIIDVRSSRARLWFDNMVNDNQIVITGTGGIPELEESQSSNLVYGITARRLSAYLHGKWRLVTRFIYKEGINPVPSLGADEKISFDIEMLLRSTLRKGLYRLYLALYIIRNALEPRVQKLYKKIKRK